MEITKDLRETTVLVLSARNATKLGSVNKIPAINFIRDLFEAMGLLRPLVSQTKYLVDTMAYEGATYYLSFDAILDQGLRDCIIAGFKGVDITARIYR